MDMAAVDLLETITNQKNELDESININKRYECSIQEDTNETNYSCSLLFII